MRKVLKYRLLVLLLLFGVVALGLWSFRRLPIDTFPDPTRFLAKYMSVPSLKKTLT